MGLVRGVLGLIADTLISKKCFTCPFDCDCEDLIQGGGVVAGNGDREGVVVKSDEYYRYGYRRAARGQEVSLPGDAAPISHRK